MSEFDDWLPPISQLNKSGGGWAKYCDELYQIFRVDFVIHKPRFGDQPVALKRFPIQDGKECTFWHLIQEGEVEADRIPNLRRCERIAWPAAIVNSVGKRDDLRVWRQTRKGANNLVVALADFSYIVVLAERSRPDGTIYLLFWTAYPVERQHQMAKLEKEWKTSKVEIKKADAAREDGVETPSTHGR